MIIVAINLTLFAGFLYGCYWLIKGLYNLSALLFWKARR